MESSYTVIQTVSDNPGAVEYFWQNLPYAFPGIITFGVGLFLFISGLYSGLKYHQRRMYFITFALMAVGHAFLGLVLSLRSVILDQDLLLSLNNYLYIAVMLMGPGSTHFLYYFTGRRHHVVQYIAYFTWLTMAFGLYGVFTGLAFTGDWHHYSFGQYPIAGIYLKPWGIVPTVTYLTLGLWVTFKYLRDTSIRKNMAVLIGFNFLLALTVSNLPSLLGIPLFPGATFSFIPMAIIAYGVFRGNFLDINDLFFKKNGIFYFLNMLVGLIFLGVSTSVAFVMMPDDLSGISWWLYIPIFSLLYAFFLGILVGGMDPGAKLNQLASFMLNVTGIILISEIPMQLDLNPLIAIRIEQIGYVFFALAPAIMFRFAFTAMNLPLPRISMGIDIMSLLVSGLAMSPYLFKGYFTFYFGRVGAAGPAVYLLVLNGVIAITIMLYYWLRNRKDFVNRMPDLVVLSLVMGSTMFMLNLVSMAGNPLYPPGNLVILPMMLLGYAVIKYKDQQEVNHAFKVSQRLSMIVIFLVPLFILLYYPAIRDQGKSLHDIIFYTSMLVIPLGLLYFQLTFLLSRPLSHKLDETYKKLDEEKKLVERSHEEIAKFNEISKKVNASTDLNEIIDMVFEHIDREFGIEAVILQLVYREKNVSYSFRTSMPPIATDEMVEAASTLKINLNPEEGGLVYQTYLRKRPVYLKHVEKVFNRSEVDRKMIERLGIKSFLLVPLVIQDEVIAFAFFSSYYRPLSLHKSDIQRISAFCEQIAGAINSSALLGEIRDEREKSEKLLLNILPEKVAAELKEKGSVKPQQYESASIMFTDFKSFTTTAAHMEPSELMEELDRVFLQFDQICDKHNVEKLKTIGDSYMCAGGLPEENSTHPVDICLAALEILQFMKETAMLRKSISNTDFWEIRLGIHTGPVIAGVVGKNKFTYDVWGDAVNVASRMESSGVPGEIHISEDTYNIVSEWFECESLGSMPLKNRGEMNTYFLKRLRPEFSHDEAGLVPNDTFQSHYSGIKKQAAAEI